MLCLLNEMFISCKTDFTEYNRVTKSYKSTNTFVVHHVMQI